MANHNAHISHAQVHSVSSTACEIADLNAELSLTGRKRKNHRENSCELNDIVHVAGMLINLSRARVDQDTVGESDGNDDMENPNPNPKRCNEKGKIDDHGRSSRGRKSGRFIGVTDDRGRWQANIWLMNVKRQVNLGRYFIAEAAARSSDKAMLVTRDRAHRRLNYPETDYDMKSIEQWRKVFDVDEEKFIDELLEQSSSYSEGCIKGLNDEAGHELLKLINEKKIWEMGL
ncbi:hypothetical protein SUGI_0458280 [Cryptomeria japonica]|nr:hypothetical protein SUGI_0458280 [Cryptomeria japonica]